MGDAGDMDEGDGGEQVGREKSPPPGGGSGRTS
jgi:hypothetical protein